MARFEGALARASARAGLVPPEDAQIISRVCATARFDARALARNGRSGTLAIPFVRELTAQVAAVSASAARHVHAGATSQDAIDTAVVLCAGAACERIAELLSRLGDATASLAERHAGTPTLSRTLLQPAVPAPFGWKVAVWLSMLVRSRQGLRSSRDQACVLQFGGAGGTLSAFGERGEVLSQALADDLGLPRAPITWHSARDGFARLGAEAAIVSGVAAKIARDVSLLMQPEVAEASEPAAAGRGGSSSLPHKRNPALCMLALEASYRAPGLASTLLAELAPEHERGLGQWQSQWLTLRELLCATASALAAMAEALEGLEIDVGAMRANLERTRGLVYSEMVSLRLAKSLGKTRAHAMTEALSRKALDEGKTLAEALRADPQASSLIPAAELPALFDPERAFGSARAMLERALAEWRKTAP